MLCIVFFQAEDGIRDLTVTGVQTCALPICLSPASYSRNGIGVNVMRKRTSASQASMRRDRGSGRCSSSTGGGAGGPPGSSNTSPPPKRPPPPEKPSAPGQEPESTRQETPATPTS